MNILLNGKTEIIADGMTIADLIAFRNLKAPHVVVELNRNIIKREQFSATTISAGDSIELIHFVGGG